MTTQPRLFTCNYTAFQPTMGTPVRSSNGAPRWKLPYNLVHAAQETFPPRRIMHSPRPTFGDQYRAHLDKVGLDVIASRFRALVVAEGEPRLVLLCFEKLDTGSWCHRSLFAGWWFDRTGETVPELGPIPAPAEVSLFD